MSLFVLDTAGDHELLKHTPKKGIVKRRNLIKEKNSQILEEALKAEINHESEDDGEYFGLPPPSVDLSKLIDTTLQQTTRKKSKVEEEMELATERVNDAVVNAHANKAQKRRRIVDLDYSDFNPTTGKFDDELTLLKTDINKELKGTDIATGGLEKLRELPSITKKKQRELGRIERSKTKGSGWFNLPATELTEEVENDLKVLQMRSVLDPKHFYKKNDLKVLPKYFQIGTVQHSPLDHYSERNTRKNKKKSLVEELLADAEVQKYTKRKYKEALARKDKYAHRKALKKMKKLKKNK